MKYTRTTIHSPLGELIAIASDTHLLLLDYVDSKNLGIKISSIDTPIDGEGQEANPILEITRMQVREYFDGNRKIFGIPLILEGTDFQKKAWQALQNIPYGETRSYKEEAIMIGNPKAVRAIGGANNKNPIVIIIPCHRVIGADGSLVGYGGGIDRKIWLLDHENKKKSS